MDLWVMAFFACAFKDIVFLLKQALIRGSHSWSVKKNPFKYEKKNTRVSYFTQISVYRVEDNECLLYVALCRNNVLPV